MVKSDGGGVVEFGGMMEMEVLRARKCGYLHPIYNRMHFLQQSLLPGWKRHSHSRPQSELCISRTNPRCRWKEESEIVVEPACASLFFIVREPRASSRSVSAGF
jgi:hypothetical protein